MSKDLPSYEDFFEDKDNLPSVDDFITEENAEELPSVEDYIEIEESTQTIEDADGNTFAEVQDIVPPWPELVKMVNDVRADIPDIPEIKYYDKELEELAEQISQVREEIPEVPEVRYYEKEVEAICEQIDLVRSEIKDLPEVKYYDEQVDVIEDRIDNLQTEVANLPEVKYYDAEIEAICEAIDAVKASIPKFPKWVNEVNEVPDFSWIGKTFSVIDDDFIKVNDTIDTLKENVKLDIKKLIEENEVKHFENRVQFGTEVKDLDTKIGEEKDKIWKELRSSSMKIWEYHKEFKDDDRKLKKQILGEYNKLKESIKEELKEVSQESVKTDELLLKYFSELREEITNLPEVKYYDTDINYVKSDIKELFDLVKTIKQEQRELQNIQEGLLNEPPSETESIDGQSDPLTPMDQKFATLDDLSSHYRLFINRIQQQIATIGGGGIEDAPNDGQTYSRKNRTWVVGGGGSGGIAGVGIQSGSVRVGTGFTDINFTGAGITVVGSGTTVTVDIPSSTITRQTETSSGVTTDFTITGGYTVGLIDVYLNGVKQRSGVDFTASDGSTVTMTPFISDGDVVEFQKYDKLNIAGITSVVNATNAYNIVGGVSFATSAGIATALNSDSSVNTSGIITASGGFVGNVTGTSTGLSGTPDITIQNLTGVAATFTGIVTYEDVTNIDSVGIVTARSGLRVVGGGLTVTGVSTFFDEVSFQGGLVEKFQTGTTLAADNTLALSDGNVIRRTSNESGNQTVNFTGVHSTLSNGDLVSFTVIITPNGSGAINVVQIDGQAITIKWSGGSAPSAGSSGKDVYTFSVFKTGTGVSDYEVYGAATNYA